MIKLIIFDAGDILYEPPRKFFDRTYKNFGKKYGINRQKHSNEWKKIENLVSVEK